MTAQKSPGNVTVLGINGHCGHHVAQTFADAGWKVTGFGRTNRNPIPWVDFIAGDAERVEDLMAAVAGADVVVNALNLPYDKWDKGRMETMVGRVVTAIGPRSGKTLMFPGNIYNYGAGERFVTPQSPQEPHTARGAIRVRTEALMQAAAARGDLQLIIVRAGDYFGPGSSGDWFDQVIMRDAAKGRFCVAGAPGVGHSWAYLPDLGRVFEKLAFHRGELGRAEAFHFAGHFVTAEQFASAIRASAPVPLTSRPFPWLMLGALGVAMPVLREVVKMRYLFDNPLELKDERLDAILGPAFGTDFNAAVGATVGRFFPAERLAA